MQHLRSDDAEIAYEIVGTGPPVVLLHPFPVHHEFWNPGVPVLSSRYRLILPDLRGHGESEIGQGPATMRNDARDLSRGLAAAGPARGGRSGGAIGRLMLSGVWAPVRGAVHVVA